MSINAHILTKGNTMKKLIVCISSFLFTSLSFAADTPKSPSAKEVLLECQTVTARSPTKNDMPVEAVSSKLIKEGFALVGGGCSLEKEQWKDTYKPMFLASRPTADGNGWFCWFKNSEETYVIGHARYCRAKLKN